MEFPNDHVVETIINCELNFNAISEPASFNVIFIDFKFQRSSLLLKHLEIKEMYSEKVSMTVTMFLVIPKYQYREYEQLLLFLSQQVQ